MVSLADIEALEQRCPDIDAQLCSTYELLARSAAKSPDSPALSFFPRVEDFAAPRVWSHRAWLERITRTANMFRRLGVMRGDVVAYVLPNLPQTHWVIWGAETSGVAFAVNPLLDAQNIRELLRSASARWLVTLAPMPGQDLWERLSAIAGDVPTLRGLLAVNASMTPLPASIGALPVHDFDALVDAAPGDALEYAPPQATDVASYFCTGGTTGLPKIAVRTHATECANALQVAAMLGNEVMAPEHATFCGLPLFHVNAQIGTGLAPWSQCGHVVLGTPLGYRTPGLTASGKLSSTID